MIQSLRQTLNALPRRSKSFILVAYDAVALVVVLWLSFQLRLGGTFQPDPSHYIILALAPVIALPTFLRFGLYRAVIRYLPERFIWTILQAMAVATFGWVFVLFIAEVTRVAEFPRSVPLFYFLLGTVVVGGARFAAKQLLWQPQRRDGGASLLIYGAGDAGRQLATALRAQGGGYVAGFVDDDKTLQGRAFMRPSACRT
jgi:FlaA1/EpsC-like NDP-sugar epimerase